MWQKFALLLAYIGIRITILFMLEFSQFWQSGFTSYKEIVSLKSLTVSQIKTLLDFRGVQCTSTLEKGELYNLLKQSGTIQYGEFIKSQQSSFEPPIQIRSETDFYEHIYEDGEDVWFIEVIPSAKNRGNSDRVLDERSWQYLGPRLDNYGIKTAIVDCQYEPRFCFHQSWSVGQIILMTPSRKTSSGHLWDTMTLTSTSPFAPTSVLSWLAKQLESRVTDVSSFDLLQEIWLNSTVVRKTQIPHMVYMSQLSTPPLILLVLALRFSSRIDFVKFNVKDENQEQVSHLIEKHYHYELPSLMVVTPDLVTKYGAHCGQLLTIGSLDLYVHTLQPRMNDLFLTSVYLVNFLALIDTLRLLRWQANLLKQLVSTVGRVLTYNVALFLLWLALPALFRFPATITAQRMALEVWQALSDSKAMHWWRAVAGLEEIHQPMVTEWVSCGLFVVVCFIWRYHHGEIEVTDPPEESWWSPFSVQLSRSRLGSNDLGIEEGMERLIERLAMPDLWLRPIVPTEYIKNLPIWRYDGWGNEEDLKSESETDVDSPSETESEILLQTHTCCQDDNCKLCCLWTTVKEIYVCHRCAMLMRRLERQYRLYHSQHRSSPRQTEIHVRLLKLCENCARDQRYTGITDNNIATLNAGSGTRWLLSPQRLIELGWSAPSPAVVECRICAICLGRYKWSVVLCGLPCGHNYHHSCIIEWLLRDNHHCPTCRWPTYLVSPLATHPHQE